MKPAPPVTRIMGGGLRDSAGRSWPADPDVFEAGGPRRRRIDDVAAVDDHRPTHERAHRIEVDAAELLPFGDDDKGIGAVEGPHRAAGELQAGDVAEDDVLAAVLDAGAEEVNDLDEAFEVVSEASDLVPVRTALQKAGIDYESAEASFVPSVTVPLGEEGARKVFRLIDALEDCDDVQNVYANFDVSDEVMAAVG